MHPDVYHGLGLGFILGMLFGLWGGWRFWGLGYRAEMADMSALRKRMTELRVQTRDSRFNGE